MYPSTAKVQGLFENFIPNQNLNIISAINVPTKDKIKLIHRIQLDGSLYY